MMQFGCKPGYYHSGEKCKRIEFPIIGSMGVPSVENRAGCLAVNGKWINDYGGICIKKESSDRKYYSGFTAPIKGAVVSWDWMDFYEANNRVDREDRGVCFAAVYANAIVPTAGLQSYTAADIDPVFELLVNDYYRFKNCNDLKNLTRDIALNLARMIKEGKIGDLDDLYYVTPKGRKTSHRARDAIIANKFEVESIVDSYKKKPAAKSFSFRRKTNG